MKAISLFSGVGGFELGFERAGIKTVLQAERDPWALEVLARRWPQTERVTDVREVTAGNPDLVYGGFPCQDLSVAGKRAGLGGDRSGLWFEFYRVLSELRPRWAVIENVPGLLSSNQGRDFAIILDGLDELGFDVAWAVLDAQHFGVPQRRRRVFVVAGPTRRGAEKVLSLCESCGGNFETGAAARQDLSGTLGAGSADSQRGWRGDLDSSGVAIPQLAYALAARDAKGTNTREGTNTLIPIQGVRRLTPLECERLMSWPDDHTRLTADGREISDSHRYRMCGNGVVASVAEWLGHRLVAVDAELRQVSIPLKRPIA